MSRHWMPHYMMDIASRMRHDYVIFISFQSKRYCTGSVFVLCQDNKFCAKVGFQNYNTWKSCKWKSNVIPPPLDTNVNLLLVVGIIELVLVTLLYILFTFYHSDMDCIYGHQYSLGRWEYGTPLKLGKRALHILVKSKCHKSQPLCIYV